MADLDFSHRVAEIPAQESVAPYKGEGVKAETHGVPNYQGTINEFAANTNWMSSVGSAVAELGHRARLPERSAVN